MSDMAARNFLAFDLGAESGRAILGTLSQGRVVLEEKHRFANPVGRMRGHLQWDLLGQWEQLKLGLRKAAAGFRLPGTANEPIGASGAFKRLDECKSTASTKSVRQISPALGST